MSEPRPSALRGVRYGSIARHADVRGSFRELWRARAFPTEAERARSSVQKAIRRALARIGAADPEIHAYLEATIVTGIRCSYRPSPTWHRPPEPG